MMSKDSLVVSACSSTGTQTQRGDLETLQVCEPARYEQQVDRYVPQVPCSCYRLSPKETDEQQITQFSEASQKAMELFGTRFINRQSELVHAIRNIAVEVNFLPLRQ